MEDQTRFSDPELDDAALARYLSGESDAIERQWIEQRVQLSEAARNELASARTVWLASGTTLEKGDIEQFVKRLRAARAQRLSQQTGEYHLGVLDDSGRSLQRHKSQQSKRQPLQRSLWSAATALVLGVVVLVVGWNVKARHSGQAAAPSTLVYTTENGERATVTLPDGGTVAMNVASRLEVPMDYMSGNHTVRIVGEGLFTVSHHTEAPLTVLAGTTAARVLGTSFVVRRYARDTATLVAVREGKVMVGTTVVTAAHLVEVGHTMVVPPVRPSDGAPFTFATGVLTLNRSPLPAAIAELDRWYDVEIRLGSPTIATQHITGDFTAGSLAELAEDSEFTLAVRVVRAGRVLTLFPRQ